MGPGTKIGREQKVWRIRTNLLIKGGTIEERKAAIVSSEAIKACKEESESLGKGGSAGNCTTQISKAFL